jgi:methylglutaconyl-CoA hydratase
MTQPVVHTITEDGVATVILDSPHNRNALSSQLIEQLLAELAAASADEAVRVVVLSHTGPVFCSGADLKETAAAVVSGEIPVARLGEVLTALWECPKPVVARVGGAARAGGLGMIAAVDIAVCAETATFAFTEVRIGVVPAVISATVLPRLSSRAATELFLTGDTFDGARAAAIGLVTAAVPEPDLDAAVARYVGSLRRGAPGALATTKGLLRTGRLEARLAELTALSVEAFGGVEGREGMAAFAQRRDPSWVR